MVKLIPTKEQWRSWSLPSKYAAIGLVLGVVSIALAAWPSTEPRPTVGNDSVVIGNVPHSVGDRSVFVATDANRNVMLNRPMAVGTNAYAGPGSIAIGSGAGNNMRPTDK